MPITPIKLTLYNPETNEVEREFSRAFVPTGNFTEMVKLLPLMDLKNPQIVDPDTAESIYALISELFGGQITIDQIKQGTDLNEFLALFETIVARVKTETPARAEPNPTLPGQTSRTRRK